MREDPLLIKNEMKGFDRKDRDYYDKLTDEQRKKFSTYLMLRWGSTVTGSSDLQAYYLISTNENVNKNFFELGKHPKLQWLTCTTVSPDMGYQNHYWLSTKKRGGNNKVYKFLEKMYPDMKSDELDTLVLINDIKDIKLFAKEMGMSDKEIKKELG